MDRHEMVKRAQAIMSRFAPHLKRQKDIIIDMSNELDRSCNWKENHNGAYETTCNNIFEFTANGIVENNFKHCPYCGGWILEI